MFYILSKTLDVLLSPLAWSLCAIGLSAWLMHRRKAHWRWALLGAVLNLGFFASPRVANGLWRSLEAGQPDRLSKAHAEGKAPPYDAIILLGGAFLEAQSSGHPYPSLNNNSERILVASRLLKENKAKVVIVTGGTSSKSPFARTEAAGMTAFLTARGIPEGRIVAEPTAYNTRQNAVATAKLVKTRGYRSLLLITSAYHMQRARECFNAVGLQPDALAVDFRGFSTDRFSPTWTWRARTLGESEAAIREWMGRFIYRIRGYSRALP